MLQRSYIKISGILLMIAGTVVIGCAVFLPSLLDINAYRDEIVSALQTSLNRKVSFSQGSFSWQYGPSFVFNDIAIKEKDGVRDFLKAERVAFRLALLPLLDKRVLLREILLDKPDVRIERTAEGVLNIDDLLVSRPDSPQVQLTGVQIREGALHWRDASASQDPVILKAGKINLSLDNLSRGKKTTFKFSGELSGGGGISLHGSARIPAPNRPLSDTDIIATAALKSLEYGSLWPYFGKKFPFPNPGGRVDFTTSYRGKVHEFTAKGSAALSGAAVKWPAIFHATLSPRTTQLEYDMKYTDGKLEAPALTLSTAGFSINGALRIDDFGKKDPRISVQASTRPFHYADIRHYVPYGVIEKGVSDYIENKIRGGTFRLIKGTLEGRLSQIAHMEIGENCNSLYIYGTAEKAVVSYGGKAPVFNNINGTLELKGKNFYLKGMQGMYGTSPFRMEGSITEYNTNGISEYPVRMEITPRPPEFAWVAGLAGADKLEFGGNSALVLTGSGTIGEYRLTGDWQLGQATYAFPGAVLKPQGMASTLAFSTVLNKTEAKISSLSFTLPPLNISATGLLRYTSDPYLSFNLQTNQFLMGEHLPILNNWQKFRLKGKMQARIQGNGDPQDYGSMNYAGNISLAGFSLLPGEGQQNIGNINGALAFTGNSVETAGMNLLYGSSQLTVKGRIANLQKPEPEVTISSPELFLKDLNLRHPKQDLSLKKLKASLSIAKERYLIHALSATINTTMFSASGVYTGGRSPRGELTATSPALDFDDLTPLNEITSPSAPADQAPMELLLKVSADSAKYGKISFTAIKGAIQREGGVFYLQNMEAGVFGGKISAKGRIAPAGGNSSRYNLDFNLTKINADQFMSTLKVSQDITGRLDMSGNITARGENMTEIKKTALGNVRLTIRDGMLRKFSILSKMFSILNVSQLFRFKLPDMVADGMPFNRISGSIAIKDGIASSQDMFISSEAMNISILGNTDLVKEELKLTIGVQPLQTVDKVVNRIPVLGWILTGKEKDFITTYFEAQGKWSDPQVTAIPAKSLARGTFNIFRRVFELPVRLFTDTGEVILGN